MNERRERGKACDPRWAGISGRGFAVLLSLAAAAPFFGAGLDGTNIAPFRAGFSTSMFAEVNENDAKAVDQHAADLGEFLTRDAKGRQMLCYLAALGQTLTEEQSLCLGELESLHSSRTAWASRRRISPAFSPTASPRAKTGMASDCTAAPWRPGKWAGNWPFTVWAWAKAPRSLSNCPWARRRLLRHPRWILSCPPSRGLRRATSSES